MNAAARLAAGIVIAMAAAAAGFYISSREAADPVTDPEAASRLMSMTLLDTDSVPQSLSQWRGKVLVINFWATWCPPCREEIPGFSRLSTKYREAGVQFVGIGIDSADKMREFAREFAVPYPQLVGNIDIMGAAAGLGNKAQALPFTVVLSRDGQAKQVKLGSLSEAQLDRTLAQLAAGN